MEESGSPKVKVDFVLSLREALERCSVSDFETKDYALRVRATTWHPLVVRPQ
jgi:hypothetical protein